MSPDTGPSTIGQTGALPQGTRAGAPASQIHEQRPGSGVGGPVDEFLLALGRSSPNSVAGTGDPGRMGVVRQAIRAGVRSVGMMAAGEMGIRFRNVLQWSLAFAMDIEDSTGWGHRPLTLAE